MCRRATGSAFAVLAWLPRDDVRWQGHPPAKRRSSPIAVRGFCPQCGTPLLLAYDGRDEIALMMGSIDEPGRWAPQYHYGIEGRLPWVDCGASLPEKETVQRF
jgi:hypothetical protein